MDFQSVSFAKRLATEMGGQLGIKTWDHKLKAEVLSVLYGNATMRPRTLIVMMRESRSGGVVAALRWQVPGGRILNKKKLGVVKSEADLFSKARAFLKGKQYGASDGGVVTIEARGVDEAPSLAEQLSELEVLTEGGRESDHIGTIKDPRKAMQFATKSEAAMAARKLPGYGPRDVIGIDVMGFKLWAISDAHMNYVARKS